MYLIASLPPSLPAFCSLCVCVCVCGHVRVMHGMRMHAHALHVLALPFQVVVRLWGLCLCDCASFALQNSAGHCLRLLAGLDH